MGKEKYLSFKAIDFLLDEDFRRWLASGNPEMTTQWENWLSEYPHKKEAFESARKLYSVLKFRHGVVDARTIDQEWMKLAESVKATAADPVLRGNTEDHDDDGYVMMRRPGGWRMRRLRAFASVAAAIVAVAVFAGIGFFYSGISADTEPVMEEYTAPKGRRTSLQLEDGTRVLLNAGSTISYPKKFEADKRELTLHGEAFFEVARNPDAPFIITTGEVMTEVLGTSFGIAAYPSHKHIDVAVVTGKVKVYTAGKDDDIQEVLLTPNQMATFGNSEKTFSVRDFDQSKQLAWVGGILYFDKADFQQIKTKLENWYGVTIILAPGIALDDNLLLTGKFSNQTLEYILDTYSYPNRFKYQIEKDTVTIY